MSNPDTLSNDRGLLDGPVSGSGFATSASHRREIANDNWMVAKSVMFCSAATAVVAILGWMAESSFV
ncbi:MAG: hypothetical protein ACRDDJ_13865 [[Mycobacterium] stephanolepidis]